MTLGIDARSLVALTPPTGVANYTRNMVYALLDIGQEQGSTLSIKLFTTGYRNRIPKDLASITHHVPIPNKLLTTLWSASVGPRFESRTQASYMWLPNIGVINFSSRIPYALTVHDISFVHYSRYFSLKSRLKHTVSRFKKLLFYADKLIAVSEYTKQDLLRRFPFARSKKILVNPLALESPAPNPMQSTHTLPKPYILYVGALDMRKNIEAICKSFVSLQKTLPEYSLVLAGPPGAAPRGYLTDYQQNKKIIIRGYVSPDELSALYQHAAVFIWPSFYEGFGFPPLEARSYNVPVITSYRTSLPEVLKADAWYINPYNTGELTAVLLRVLSNQPAARSPLQGFTLPQRTWREAALELLNFLVP